MTKSDLFRKLTLTAAFGVSVFNVNTGTAVAGPYFQTDLVSNIAGLGKITDSQLVNPWGFSHSATSPFWTSNQGKNTATLYAVTHGIDVAKVNINPPSGLVGIPTAGAGPQGPTGQVNNTNAGAFLLPSGQSSRFIFANLNGTISGWAGGANATVAHTTPGAVYTGLAINAAQTRLYAANAVTGNVDIFDSTFSPVNLPGAFAAPAAIVAKGLVPFNVQNINGQIYVTYAPPGRANEIDAVPGEGAIAVFDQNGALLKTPIVGSNLAAPWGITLAPGTFGKFGGDLLVGNFSFTNSEINAFDPASGLFKGSIQIDPGPGNTAGGLWSIGFGIGGNNGKPNTLYFSDGLNGERDGLFGAVSVPEPWSLSLFASALALAGMSRLMSKRKPPLIA